MGMGFGASSSNSSANSTPQDMTPGAYTNLRQPIADLLLGLATSGGPAYNDAGTINLGSVTNPQYSALQTQIANTPATIQQIVQGVRNNRGSNVSGKPGQGGGGIHQNGQQTVTVANPTYQALIQQLSQVNPTIGTANGTAGAAQGADTATLAAPLTDQQNALINQIVSSVSNPSTLTNASNQGLMDTISGKYLSPDSNPFLSAAVQAGQKSLTDNFERVIVPQLLSRFTQSGQEVQGSGSSAFAHESGLAANDLEQNLGNVATTLYGNNYTTERANQLNAITQANQVTNDELTRMTSGLQSASLPQLVQDLGIQRGLAEFDRRMNVVLQALQLAGGLSAPTIANSSQSKGSSSSFQGSLSL